MGINTTLLLNNRYQIIETLGRGGFGETFLAIDTHLPSGRKCVIKQLKPIINESNIPQWMYERFEQEARILEQLGDEHEQIPRLHAYFCEDKNFYLVQEWIEGITLTEKVQQEGKLSADEVEQILLKLLPVLGYLHHKNIVHRDVKPDNIIFRAKDNLPVLIDFGAVKDALTTFVYSQGHSAYSIAIGTPGYMSSEQAAGRPIYSSDLYSLGLTAVYLLTGKPPQSLQTDSRTGEILWRDELPDLHSNLAGVIDRAIRFSPRERFANAQEMLKALQPLTGGETAVFGHRSVVPVYPTNKNHTISNDRTIAVGGGNINRPINEIYRHPARHKATLAAKSQRTSSLNSINNDSIDNDRESNNWFAPLVPLFWLSVIAIASFAVGYNLIANQFLDSESPVINEVEENETPTPQPENREPVVPVEPEPEPEPEPDTSNSEEIDSGDEGQSDVENEIIPEGEVPIDIEIIEPEIEPESSSEGGSSSLPVLSTGTVVNELMGRFGQPSNRQSLPSQNATVWTYQNVFNRDTQISYTVDNNNGAIKEIDIYFPVSTNVEVMTGTFDRLLKGNLTPVVKEAFRQVVEGEQDLRSFNTGNWTGFIRKTDNSKFNLNVRLN